MDVTYIQTVKEVIKDVLSQLGFQAECEHEASATQGDIFHIKCPESSLLIGRQGANLHALEVLARIISSRRLSIPKISFIIDIDDYRLKRDWFLRQTAKAAAEQAKFSGKITHMEPMASFERRVVHEFLQEKFPDVTSESEGEGSKRHIVIKPK